MEFTRELIYSDERNLNGRIYPRHLIEKEISKYNDKSLLGQIGHPDDGVTFLSQASHVISNLDLKIKKRRLPRKIKKQYKKADAIHEKLFPDGRFKDDIINDLNITPSKSYREWCQKNYVLEGVIETLNTDQGKIAEELLSSGSDISISPRGYGKVGDNGVLESYELLGFDLIPTEDFAWKDKIN